jgi:hypothetical protein
MAQISQPRQRGAPARQQFITIPSTTVTSTTMGTLEGGTGFATVIATVNVTSGSLLLKITQQGLILMILPMSPTFGV